MAMLADSLTVLWQVQAQSASKILASYRPGIARIRPSHQAGLTAQSLTFSGFSHARKQPGILSERAALP